MPNAGIEVNASDTAALTILYDKINAVLDKAEKNLEEEEEEEEVLLHSEDEGDGVVPFLLFFYFFLFLLGLATSCDFILLLYKL